MNRDELIRKLRLSATAEALLLEIADRSASKGYCWGKQVRLGMEVDKSKRTVIRAISLLRELNLIRTAKIDWGMRRSLTYSVNWDEVRALYAAKQEERGAKSGTSLWGGQVPKVAPVKVPKVAPVPTDSLILNLHKEEPPPLCEQTALASEWAAVEEVVRSAKIQDAPRAVKMARAAGCTPGHVEAIVSAFRSRPWLVNQLGLLHYRICNAHPSVLPDNDLPDEPEAYRVRRQQQEARQAAEAGRMQRDQAAEKQRLQREREEALERTYGELLDDTPDQELLQLLDELNELKPSPGCPLRRDGRIAILWRFKLLPALEQFIGEPAR